MILRVYFKDPDGFGDAMDDALAKEVAHIKDREEAEAVRLCRAKKAWDVLRQWVEYQEYCMVEFDTEAETARVLPVSEHAAREGQM